MTKLVLHDYWVLWTPTNIREDYPEGGIVRIVRKGKSKWDCFDVVGFFYINKPFFRKKLFHDLKERYGEENLKFKAIEFPSYISKPEGLACRMYLTKSSWDNLVPLEFTSAYECLKAQLDELSEHPSLPYLHISFDSERGYYRARIKS